MSLAPRFTRSLALVTLAAGALLSTSRLAEAQVISAPVSLSVVGDVSETEPAVAVDGDRILAVWRKTFQVGGFFNAVAWSMSVDGGATWRSSEQLPRGDLIGVFGDHTALATDGQGRFLVAAQAIGPARHVVVYRGEVGGGTVIWQPPVRAVTDPPGTTADLPDALDLSCDPVSGALYLTWTKLVGNNRPGSNYYESEQIQLSRSLDGGATWSAPLALSNTTGSRAQSAVGPDGDLSVVWLDFVAGELRGRRSVDGGASFGPEFVVAPVAENFLGTPDFPSEHPALAVDTSPGPYRGRLYATWAERATGTVAAATSSVYELEPNEWAASATPVAIGQDIYGETSGVPKGSSEPNDDDLFVFDGIRGQTIQLTGEVLYHTSGNPDLGHAVYFQCVEDTAEIGGRIGLSLTLPPTPPRRPFIYTLPATGRYYLRMLPGGFVSIGYVLHLRELEVGAGSVARDARDVVMVHSSDGGATWSPKVRVNDDPATAHQGLPSVAVDELGLVHTAWYDRREDPGCGYEVQTYWGMSSDGGASFPRNARVSVAPSPWRSGGVGYHLGLAAGGGRVCVLWTQVTPGEIGIYAARIEDVVTGIAVAGLAAELEGAAVRVRWTVSDASEVQAFRVHRAEGNGEFHPLSDGTLASHGVGHYEHVDADVTPGVRYRYWLEVLTRSGISEWLEPVAVVVPARSDRLTLTLAGPNPFAREARLALSVPARGTVQVRVYDILGHEVARLHDGDLPAGARSLSWNGSDARGRAVAPGIYLVRATGAGDATSLRLVRTH